ncbi:collagen alpha-1(XXIII) chain-like [Gadus morhua]|uniref:collagen alpha-1(XXIII) chain-like n=1 Tax=Gadus morhua TaxID=8049 RepID=UPI0011B75D8D|nr:collagen alpha-1(XXIII) chain-like [Gadus morhua]
MDTARDSSGESKPGCQFAPRSGLRQWLPGLPIALCLLLSMSSIAVCLLMSVKTFQLESRLQTEMDKISILQPSHSAFLKEDGTLIPELSTPIEKLVEEKLTVIPKLRSARDVAQECSCPPGPPGKRGRMGRRGDPGQPGKAGRDGYPVN